MNDRTNNAAVGMAKRISVAAMRPYNVLIGAGLTDALGAITASACSGAARAMLVADDTVDALYGDRAAGVAVGGGDCPWAGFPFCTGRGARRSPPTRGFSMRLRARGSRGGMCSSRSAAASRAI